MLLLDEPTAGLDADTEAGLAAIRRRSWPGAPCVVWRRTGRVRPRPPTGRWGSAGPGRATVDPGSSAPLGPAPSPLRRAAELLGGRRRRLGLGAAAPASLAAACGRRADGRRAWLISRAAQQPPVLYLMVAVVAVRAFGIGRGVLRYVERLVAHDAALRVLGDAAGPGLPTGWSGCARPGCRRSARGDLLARFVADVDGLQDVGAARVLPLRRGLRRRGWRPRAVVAVAGAAGRRRALAALVLVAVVVPLAATARLSAGPTRGAVAAARAAGRRIVDLPAGRRSCSPTARVDRRLARLAGADRELRRPTRAARARRPGSAPAR